MSDTATAERRLVANLHGIDRAAKGKVSETMKFSGIVAPWMSYSHPLWELGGRRELFSRGSIFPWNEGSIPLSPMHNLSVLPIGRSIEYEDREEGLWMRFELAPTPQGREAATLIDDGFINGLSVEMMYGLTEHPERMGDETVHVIDRAPIQGVGLVGTAAYPDAYVTDMRNLSHVRSVGGVLSLTPDRDALKSWLRNRTPAGKRELDEHHRGSDAEAAHREGG